MAITGIFVYPEVQYLLGKLAGTAVKGGIEKMAEIDALEQLLGVLSGGVKFPWQTPQGEGFIAPWTQKTVMQTGEGGEVWTPESTLPGAQESNVVKTWNTGTATFYMFNDGRIGCRKKNGVFKFWRPQKHIVIPRNPRIGTLISADKRVSRLMKGLTRRLPAARRSARSRVNITSSDARAIRGLLEAGR